MATLTVLQQKPPAMGEVGLHQLQWWKGTHFHSYRKYLINFKAEAETLQKAAIEIRDNWPRTSPNVVIFTGAFSVLSKFQNAHRRVLKEFETARVDLATQTNLTLQWIPADNRIQGNEQADGLAGEWGKLDLEDRCTFYSDEKTIVMAHVPSPTLIPLSIRPPPFSPHPQGNLPVFE